MAIEVTMPQLSDTMSEGKILTWLVKEGDKVERGDALAEVATDKADLEIESFNEGTLLKIHAPAGTTVTVGSIIAHIGEAGESVPDVSQAAAATPPSPAPEATPATEPAPAPSPTPAPAQAAAPTPAPSNDGNRIKISPLAKNLALSHGVDVTAIQGSGEGGRIIKKDIEAAMSKPAAVPAAPAPRASTPAPAQAPGSTAPLSSMRQTIADRMVQSVNEIPHFFMTTKILMDECIKVRSSLKTLPQYEGVTFNHLIVKAAALALRAHPRINAAYRDGSLLQPSNINVGIVTALEDGLMIPIVKNADHLPLADIVYEARGLVQRARAGRPKADDLTGGTFSISNVGNLAVESFTAIINPGQGAILAVGAIEDEPVVLDGELVISSVMRVTLSVDHRIIDGVVGAQFLTELKRLIEDPVVLLA